MCACNDAILMSVFETRSSSSVRLQHIKKHASAEDVQMTLAPGPQGKSDPCTAGAQGGVPPRVMLLCGADVLESFLAPGVWRPDHLRDILSDEHGVVCVARCSDLAARLL